MAAGFRLHPIVAITAVFLVLGGGASAQNQLEARLAAGVRKIEAACSDDLKKFCSTVTPGDERLMLCIQAYEDQVSHQCDYALFEASRNLNRALDRISRIADVCWNDIEKYCSHLPEGGWRIAQCLASQRMILTPTCQTQMPGAPAAQEARPQRIKIEVDPPKAPELQQVYDVLKQRQWLEKAQEYFGIFKLPEDVTIRATSCGMSNAWYTRGTVTICYEYLEDIRKSMPDEPTPQGLTPADAVVGQFVYTLAHEMGHALFDVLDIPILGQPEDAADQFATYLMLKLDKEQAHRLIAGAAYTYKNYIRNPTVTVPLIAFSDAHGAPMQRFYNLLCMAYGADPDTFEDVVEKNYLPENRARSCRMEYFEADFAFNKLFVPVIDPELGKIAMGKTWLPSSNTRLFK
jgi:Putative metallopeptidase